MKKISFTEFRRQASDILNDVERGESVQITRHGKVIARIIPATDSQVPSWKRPRPGLVVPGISLSKTIIDERSNSDR